MECAPTGLPIVSLFRLLFSHRRAKAVTVAITTTPHRHTKLPKKPAWYSGPGEAPKMTGPMTLPTQYPTNVDAETVDFSVSILAHAHY